MDATIEQKLNEAGVKWKPVKDNPEMMEVTEKGLTVRLTKQLLKPGWSKEILKNLSIYPRWFQKRLRAQIEPGWLKKVFREMYGDAPPDYTVKEIIGSGRRK